MNPPFTRERAGDVLDRKRRRLGRGLSYTEKILYLHQVDAESAGVPERGRDPIRLLPDRVAMQDATAQMAMLQFMQAGREQTGVPATIHCDHLLRAARGEEADLKAALIANREVYEFLASAAARFGIGFWGPGSGIIHQVLLENYAVPGGLMIGTDSHTPNAGGLGMIAIGVGGADAAEVMAGLPWETTAPILVGVRLSGSLKGWASAKDVILEMLRRLTVKGGTGRLFEYFGKGAESLTAAEKATITNMGAELGATSSVFVYDESMDAYLKNVGRAEDADRARSFQDVLAQDPDCIEAPETVFDELIDLDLGEIRPAHAGPFSPDRVTSTRDFRRTVSSEGWPDTVSAVLLGSCTNSSYADLCAAAQVLEQGAAHGLGARVPFLLSPGSRQVYETIRRDSVLQTLLNAGATVLTASCGPCIGQWDRMDVPEGVPNCLFTTFNRNFRGRNDANPETRAFLTSPGPAAALALSGDPGFDPETDTLEGADGEPFRLAPPFPPSLPPGGLVQSREAYVPPPEDGSDVEIRIPEGSERLEFLEPFPPWDGRPYEDLPVLVKTRGKTTTDHISPGGAWLRYRGHLTNISRNLLQGAVNAFTGETGRGANVFTGETGVPFHELARDYRSRSGGSVILGDENYGEGSSREHAAMSPRFLGVLVVASRSFARIHEANLKKQGILPLTFEDPGDYDRIQAEDRMSFPPLSELVPGGPVTASVRRPDETTCSIPFTHTLTREQIGWLMAGSALNTVRERKDA
ncbi:MAG: aconitate hydratase [Deltaproteobacteria bacterium]|nr:aconitate hydratase [Deltaproteobacteria bacterium]